MMYTSFNVNIAIHYGVNAAIVLNAIYESFPEDIRKTQDVFDGMHFVRMSAFDISAKIICLTERQVRSAIKILASADLIKRAHIGSDVELMDRTYSYALLPIAKRMMK